MKKLLIIIALPLFSTACGNGITEKKFNPGHYVSTGGNVELNNPLWMNEPAVAGINRSYEWQELEPEKGKYDFSIIKQDLELLRKNNKQMVLFFKEKSFRENEHPLPEYLRHLEVRASEGWTPKRWNDEFIDRFNAICIALGKEFDNHPNFEGIALQESALSISRQVLQEFPEYSDQIYTDALKKIIVNTAQAFPKSRVFWYVNFIGEGKERLQRAHEVLDVIKPYQVILSGPDILPYRTLNHPGGIYDLNKTLYNEFVFANSMQYDSYRHHKNDVRNAEKNTHIVAPEDIIPIEELFIFGRDVLHLKYIFWASGGGNKRLGHNTFEEDAMNVIRKYPKFNQ